MGIEIRDLRKRFEDNEVLKGIDFTFETGKVNMIIGQSGSGKSVLLKCMVGLEQPDTGQVLYDGQDIVGRDANDLRPLRKQMGMLFQSAALFDSMTVAQNVAFPLVMYTRLRKNEIKERVGYYLNKVNLKNAGDKFPAEISGGMKKRVGIARAIVMEPKYLFCDEPNSGLDPQTAEVIDQLIRKITDDLRMTTIVVSHDMKSVLTIGDKILFIYKGNKEWQGSREEVSASDNPILKRFIEISGVAYQSTPHQPVMGPAQR